MLLHAVDSFSATSDDVGDGFLEFAFELISGCGALVLVLPLVDVVDGTN